MKPFKSNVEHPAWSRDIVIYEVNLRQYSPTGSFRAFSEHLPRLMELGVDVLWLMPIHPIGREKRKGELGSYYAVADFTGINPEHGTLEDFRVLLGKAHEHGFKVLLDWVPNHTAWDHPWTKEHPEWYERDDQGSFIPPRGTDWTDVIQLNWSNREMQEAMLQALRYWVDLGIDGYRVDHPHNTPAEFWATARKELEKIRPVFMLAENEEQTRFLEDGFDMNYAWVLHHLMNDIASGKKTVRYLRKYFRNQNRSYPDSVYRMNFITNHDENSWAGTIAERLGAAQDVMSVLMFSVPGVPLIYSGQEAGLDKRLEFFKPDPIDWKESKRFNFYRNLIRIKKKFPPLWNGDSGGPIMELKTSGSRRVFAFYREKGSQRIIAILNLSKNSVSPRIRFGSLAGEYLDAFSTESRTLAERQVLEMEPWSYFLFTSV